MQAITTELSALGVRVDATEHEMTIHPSQPKPTAGHLVHTYGDHRIAMAFAPLLLAHPDLTIEAPGVVDKSFPEFWEEFDKVRNAQ